MNDNIRSFLHSHHYMNVACVDENMNSYTFTCYYAFDEEYHLLLFTSSPEGTRHVPLLYKNKKVSGTILPDCMPVDSIIGIQYTGYVCHSNEIRACSKNRLLNRFPIIKNFAHEIWGIKVDFVKLTDNSKGFGYKEIWREE